MADFFHIHHLNLETIGTPTGQPIGKIKDTNTGMVYFYFKRDDNKDIENGYYDLIISQIALPSSFHHVVYKITPDQINLKYHELNQNYNNSPFLVCMGNKFLPHTENKNNSKSTTLIDYVKKGKGKKSCGDEGCRVHLFYQRSEEKSLHIKIFARPKSTGSSEYYYYIPMVGHGAVANIVYTKMNLTGLAALLRDDRIKGNYAIAINKQSLVFEKIDDLNIIIYPDHLVSRNNPNINPGEIEITDTCKLMVKPASPYQKPTNPKIRRKK